MPLYDSDWKQHLSQGKIFLGDPTAATAKAFSGCHYASAALNFGTVGAAGNADSTVTVTGAASGDIVHASPRAAFTLPVIAYVSAANTVTIKAINGSAAGIDPDGAGVTWDVFVFKIPA